MPTDYDVHQTDALIIGAGAGGLRAAIAMAERGVRPLVLGKRDHGDAHTIWAAGGINASLGSLDEDDDWTIHAADTLKEGHFLNDVRAVELMCHNIPARILELQEWGCEFDTTDEGEINQRYFGAQSYRRTCFVGDRTGEALLETLVDRAKQLDVPYRDNVYVTDLLAERGKISGALAVDMETGRPVVFDVGVVILAAGGHAEIYARSSSRVDENTGDGAALALGAGAALRDVEMVQFHPTGMVEPEEYGGRLVTEAVRGEGGRLFNADGERFMEEYSPKQMELDARDVVARAIANEIRQGRGVDGGVHLDISHRDREFLEDRLPKMVARFDELGVDISQEPMLVAPTTHYAMGGVQVDFATGATAVTGLFAVGEVTAGLHGANRLGGNSLAETIAFGELTGRHVAELLERHAPEPLEEAEITPRVDALEALVGADGPRAPGELIEELRQIMSEHAGILRDAEELERGQARLRELDARCDAELGVGGDMRSRDFEMALNLRFMRPVAQALLQGALMREESRGGHHREDFPDEDPDWRKNILVRQRPDGELAYQTAPVRPTPRAIQRALDQEHELDYHHLE